MYSFKSRVRFSEVDSELKLTLPALLNYFQDCSIFHSESIHAGVKALMDQGHVWILSSWQIYIHRYPDLCEELTISTWPYDWKSFFGYRNFKMEDASGNVVAYANTLWVYTDLNTHRPARIPQELCERYSKEAPLDMPDVPRKMAIPEGGTPQTPIPVRHSDIDSNNHVNNAHYILIAEEFLPDGFTVRRLRTEYKKAAVYGDTIYPVVSFETDNVTITLNDAENNPYAIIEFQG